MAVRDIPGHRQRGSFWKRLFGQLSRYDLVLAAIPLVFAMALMGHVLAPVPFHFAVGSGATVSGLLVADALYLNPPTESSAESG
jgi:hypothetical protein